MTMGSVTDYYRIIQTIFSNTDSEVLRKFSLLTSDEERVAYVMKLKFVKDAFCIEPRYIRKSYVEAKNHREAGNRLYKEKNFSKALTCYNNAVLYAPWPKVLSCSMSSTNISSAAAAHNGQHHHHNGHPSSHTNGNTNNPTSDSDSNFSQSTKPPTTTTSGNYTGINGQSETSDYISESASTSSSTHSKAYSRVAEGSIVTQCDSLLTQSDPEFCELPLALGNRSATLCQLGVYQKCIEDIDLSLQLGFPLHLRYKLFDRKARCLIQKQLYDKAILYFERVKTSLVASNLTVRQREKVVENCEKQITACKALISDNNSGDSGDEVVPRYAEMVAPLIENTSKMFLCATESFEVRYKDMKGRYGMTSKPLRTGDVVISEGPYCSVLELGQYDKRCYQCFKLLPVSPFSCQSCAGVKYCTSKCRETSWDEIHRWECHYLGLLHSSGTGVLAHLALVNVFKGGWSNIVKCQKNTRREATKSLFIKSGVFLGGFASLHNLLPHSESRPVNELYQYTILAIFLLKIAKYTDFFDEINNLTLKEKEKLNGAPDVTLCGTLLKFLQIIACNGIEVTEMCVGTNLQNTNPEPIGLALYPTVSLLNHSCNPAMELIFYDNRCVVRPIRNLQTAQELTIDYGYLFYVTRKEQRQTSLRSQYHFRCDCEACVLNWPVRNELKDGIAPLKCIYCKVPLLLYGNNNPLEVNCENCGVLHNPIEYFQKIRGSSKECDRMVERARMFEIKEAISAIERHVALSEQFIIMPWKEYTNCVSTLKQCYRMLGNVSHDVTKQLKMNRLRYDV